MKQDYPEEQIDQGNSWYISDQLKARIGSSGRQKLTQNRWNIFCAIIQDWMQQGNTTDKGKHIKLLDAGCGDGANLIGLTKISQEHNWDIDLTAIDYNPVRIKRVKESKLPVQVEQASLLSLPFSNESFDILLCNHVLEHIPDLSTALNELYRVLKKGGLLIAGVPNEGCLTARLRNKVFQRSISQKTDHVNFFTEKSLTHHLAKAGLKIQSVKTETFFFPISYINMLLNEFTAGHAVMSLLRKIFPSQAGGLIIGAIKLKV